MSRLVLVAACVCAALLAPAASAQAQTTVTVPGVPAAGPAKYDKSFVTKIGPSSAKTVLVLVPGFSAGAGGFTLVGRDLVRQVPGLDLILGGHTHTFLEKPTPATGPDGRSVLIGQTGWGGINLGRVDVWFDRKGQAEAMGTSLPIGGANGRV